MEGVFEDSFGLRCRREDVKAEVVVIGLCFRVKATDVCAFDTVVLVGLYTFLGNVALFHNAFGSVVLCGGAAGSKDEGEYK